jgi:hypothetical protein
VPPFKGTFHAGPAGALPVVVEVGVEAGLADLLDQAPDLRL